MTGPGEVAVGRGMDAMLDHAPCGFISFATDGTVTAVNATLLERLQHSRDAVLGRHIEGVLSVAGRIFFQTHFFPLLRMQGRAQEIYLLLRTADGGQVGVLTNAVRHEREGVEAYDCIFFEVEERRKFEEALLHARRTADEANAALRERTRDLEAANAQLEAAAVELELQHQQLQEQAAEMEVQQEQLQELAEDLQRNADEAARQRAAADEANQAKSTFLAMMSHELRTPLNAIGGYVQLLEMGVQGPVTDAQRDVLQRVDRSQRHLLRLINDILNLSRIEAGRVEYVIESVPARELVRQVVPMIEPQAAERGTAVRVTIPDDLVVRADKEKAQQILLNLLSNAVKFTAPGGSILVDAEVEPTDDRHVRIHVHDTGSGIPADMLDRIFEPFVQVDVTRRRSAEGTGLGLAISRDLARGMGGDITATSTLGEGSRFTILLPAATA